MPRPKAHYSLIARNHVSGKRLKVELIDLPFSDGRGALRAFIWFFSLTALQRDTYRFYMTYSKLLFVIAGSDCVTFYPRN